MKKNLFFAAMAVVAMASCTKTEEVVTASNDAIGFSTFTDRITKAEELTTTDLDYFYIDAFYTDETNFKSSPTSVNFMKNQLVELSGTAYTYSPVKYWPNEEEDMISFFAYSLGGDEDTTPLVTFGATPTANKHSITYNCPAAAADQKDLVFAYVLDASKKSNSAGVQFDFAHILSQLVFQIEKMDNVDTNTTITVTDATVNYGDYVGRTATYTLTAATNGSVSGAWGTPTNKYVSKSNAAAADIVLTEDLQAMIDPLMIIPQTATGINCEIKYDVTTTDSATTDGSNDSTISNTATFTIPSTAFEAGKKYYYNITVNVTEVVVTASIASDWETGAVTDTVDIPTDTTNDSVDGQ